MNNAVPSSQKLSSILLVDDDPTTNYLNQKLLHKLAIADQVLVALNGLEALDLLLSHCQEATPEHPVLLFLDVNMPMMNGIEFLEDYQQLPLAHKESIIITMLTTSMHPQDVQRVERMPIAGFLDKPLTAEKVEQVLKNHHARRLPK